VARRTKQSSGYAAAFAASTDGDRSLPPPADRRTRPIVADRRRIVTLSRRVNTRSVYIGTYAESTQIRGNYGVSAVARRGDGGMTRGSFAHPPLINRTL